MQLFDYLLLKLKERGIKIFLTPINFYGGTDYGFKNKWGGKNGCLTNADSFPAQANYLKQFVEHVNPYTGIAYKDDPDILGFEINNEPFDHDERPDLTTQYIQTMVDAIKGTGCEKPVFYNVSHNIEQIDNFCAADIQGGTFQWYPTGLYSNHDHKGNILPNVDFYHIPFADHPRFKNMAKAAYEFSPSDVKNSSYLYPVMARSFREAGFQFAAQFAYSPMHVGWANIEWQAHYLSLPWAPKKSMGMVIANEVFHRVPLGKSYGRYPHNTAFDAFQVSYEDDLAEMNTEEVFLYTNHTATAPKSAKQLKRIAGTGNSPVIQYEGTGAYFMDKLEAGVWRLEVMPDALIVSDPHFSASMDKEVSVIKWNQRKMGLDIPDLGQAFSVKGLNDGNDLTLDTSNGEFVIPPGAYLITRKNVETALTGEDFHQNFQLKEFYAPEEQCGKTYVLHDALREVEKGGNVSISAEIVSPDEFGNVELVLLLPEKRVAVPMEQTAAFEYSAQVPEEYLSETGFLRYYITVEFEDEWKTYPNEYVGNHPLDRKMFKGQRFRMLPSDPWKVAIVEPVQPICLYDTDADGVFISKFARGSKLNIQPAKIPGKSYWFFNAPNLEESPDSYVHRSFCGDRISERISDLKVANTFVLYGHSLHGKPCKLQLALVMKDGTTYGAMLDVGVETGDYEISLDAFEHIRTTRTPRPTPYFNPWWIEMDATTPFDLEQVECLQFKIGPSIAPNERKQEHGVAIAWVKLDLVTDN